MVSTIIECLVIPTHAQNGRAMTRDEEHYPCPDVFNPDRFLPEGAAAPLDPRRFIFGYNRRWVFPSFTLDYPTHDKFILLVLSVESARDWTISTRRRIS